MNLVDSAIEVLRRTEASLRELAATAATSGDYDSVVRIVSWAQVVKDIAARKPIHDEIRPALTNGERSALPAKVSKRSPRRAPTSDYPKFFRRDDQLVRVAWSKRERSEYQHKTSKAVLQRLAETLCEAGKEGQVFSTEDILPLMDADGQPVPAYQAYVCIALLKQAGLIDQHGRQGYSLTEGDDFKEAVNSMWQTLSDKLPRRPR